MYARTLRAIGASGLVLAFSLVGVAPASAALTPSRDADAVAAALADPLGPGVLTDATFPVIPPVPSNTAECADGIDNDGDGLIDFTPPVGETADPGCASATDNREQDDPPPECANGFDDDGDWLIDFTPPVGEAPDPGCTSAADNNEVEGEPDPVPACANGDDDDGDGFIDFTPPVGETADPGCTSAADLDEGSEGLPLGADTNPVSVSTTALAGFPTSGSSFGILSSGDSTIADDLNDSGGSGQDSGGDGGTHGSTFYDLVTLKLDLTVPGGANCLALDFRFLSEEFPEYVGGTVNDGFVAELDVSDFTADEANNNAVVAPHNFAFDATGKVISINTAGFSEADAAGTTYDGATPKLRASTPITPGTHAIYLSVFDQGDGILDSAAFVDNLRTFTVPEGTCKAGATDDTTPPDTTITAGPEGTTSDNTPTFEFTSTEANSTFQCRVDGGAWVPCTTPFTTATLADGAHTFEVRAIDAAGNVDPTPASRAFTVDTSAPTDTTPPDTTITLGPTGPTSDSTPTFTFVSSEAGSTFQCRIDGGAWAACSTPFTTPTLADGAHTFEVRAIDSLGNVDPTPAGRTFTVTPPAPAYTCVGKTATIVGTAGSDEIDGTDGNDVIVGLGGNDVINAGGGNDVVCGGPGNDKLFGASGKDLLDGEDGKDKLGAGGGADDLIGGDGNDRLIGNGGADELDGGAGADDLAGAAGNDVLRGKAGDDELEAEGGDDKLFGDAGDDFLDGGPGRDKGEGGSGQDVVVRCET